LLAHGCLVKAIVIVFSLGECTVLSWQSRSGKDCQEVREHLVEHRKEEKKMPTRRILSVVLIVGVMMLAAGISPRMAGPTRARPPTQASVTVPDSDNAVRMRSGSPAPDLGSAMYRLGSELQISTPSSPLDADRHKPAVAYNWRHNQYLVVWHNQWPGNRDIYAQRVSDSGTLVGPWFAVSAGPGDRLQPAVAYNATNDEYLVVWMYEVSADVYEVWGRAIAWDNSYQKTEKRLITYPNRSFYGPCVAWNSYRNEYLVVWNAFDTTTSFPPGVPVDIAGARASGDWSTIYTSKILTTYSGPHQVDITYNVAMNQYFVAFVVVHTAATSGNDIYGLRVNWDGSPADSLIEIYKDDAAGQRKHQNHPAVATNEQDKYMVVWEHEYSATDHDIYARKYNANGTPDGSYFAIASWTEDDTVPDVAANGANREWVTVWQRALPGGSGYSIHGFRWGSAGSSVYTYVFDVAKWTFVEAKNPAVAADIPGYLIVYEEVNPPAKQHIYGRMWWPEAAYVPLVLHNR
jgi:hypothetical protein